MHKFELPKALRNGAPAQGLPSGAAGLLSDRRLRSVANWISGEFRLPYRWHVSPFDSDVPVTVVMDMDTGHVRLGDRKAAIFIWYPSGFLAEIGLAPHTWSRAVASDVADMIGGPLVDARTYPETAGLA